MSITAVYKIFSIEKYKVLIKMRSNFLLFFVVYFTALCIPLPHFPPTPTPSPPPRKEHLSIGTVVSLISD